MSGIEANRDIREQINSSLSDLVEILPVEISFIEQLHEFLSTKNIYLFGSEDYNKMLEYFLSSGDNKESFFELITVFYSCLVIRGVDYPIFNIIAKDILSIKKYIPTSENVKRKEGDDNLLDSMKNQPDIYKVCLYLLHMNISKLYRLTYEKLKTIELIETKE